MRGGATSESRESNKVVGYVKTPIQPRESRSAFKKRAPKERKGGPPRKKKMVSAQKEKRLPPFLKKEVGEVFLTERGGGRPGKKKKKVGKGNRGRNFWVGGGVNAARTPCDEKRFKTDEISDEGEIR